MMQRVTTLKWNWAAIRKVCYQINSYKRKKNKVLHVRNAADVLVSASWKIAALCRGLWSFLHVLHSLWVRQVPQKRLAH